MLIAQVRGVAQAQEPGAPAPDIPIQILYEIFFRDVATVDADAAKLDAAKAKGGDDLRQYYRNTLRLTPEQANALKKNADSCNQTLNKHAAKALNAIAALKASTPVTPGLNTAGVALPGPISRLQDERTELTFRCIQSLQADLGTRTFRNIDVYVRTAIATRTKVEVPPMKPPTAPLSATEGKGEGK